MVSPRMQREKPIADVAFVNAGDYLLGFSEKGIVRVTLGRAKTHAKSPLPAFVLEAMDDLRRYDRGERVDFQWVLLDRSSLTPFQSRVLNELRKVPYGETIDYGSLAASAGQPGASRAVGTAVGRNPWMVVVPCHRVLRRDGGIGGFSAPGGLVTKRRLLALEGITVK